MRRRIHTYESHRPGPSRVVCGWGAYESQSATRRIGRMDTIEDEYPEIRRAAGELGVDPYDIAIALLSGDPMGLTDDVWRRLENTDSYGVQGIGDFEALSGGYGKDYRRIASAPDPDQLPPALVVEYEPGRFHLVAGNTRLMWMRAIGHTPMVVVGRLGKNNTNR